jgi:tetratricopeptide (TPR) repeat protein
MGNWLVRLTAPASAGIAVIVLAAGLALAAPPAAAAEKKPQLSDEVIKKLKPAQDACQKNDWDTCVSLAREGLAVAKTPYEKQQSLQFVVFGLGKKGDFPAYADAVEQLNELDIVPADDKVKSYPNLAKIYYQQKNFEKAEKYARLWADTAPSSEAYGILVAIYYTQQNCPATLAAQEKGIEVEKAAGKEPTEQELRILNSCYYRTNDKPHREAVMEALVQRFPKADYYTDLLQVYQEENLDKRALLNLLRFGVDKDYIARESLFVEYADQALDAGAPAEALKVIETATAKGAFKIIAQTDRNGKLQAAAKQQTADDKKLLPQLDKEARAGKNGEADVKVGLAYLGFGDYAKAAEAIERGLTPDRVAKVKRVDDAEMMLGICDSKLGKKDEAKKAFTAAQADPRMTKAATIWLQSL